MLLRPRLSPSVKILPPATATVEYPPPSPFTRQASGGPPAGHSVKRPVSYEMPSPFGPRQRDHSPRWASVTAGLLPVAALAFLAFGAWPVAGDQEKTPANRVAKTANV